MSQEITIVVDDGSFDGDGKCTFTAQHAWAFAQMLKRCSWTTCERLSEPGAKRETQLMIDAVCMLQRAFRDAGIAPR